MPTLRWREWYLLEDAHKHIKDNDIVFGVYIIYDYKVLSTYLYVGISEEGKKGIKGRLEAYSRSPLLDPGRLYVTWARVNQRRIKIRGVERYLMEKLNPPRNKQKNIAKCVVVNVPPPPNPRE